MSRRRSALGTAVLFALALSAFTAASASAVGTTAFTCAKTETGATFKDGHCKEAGSGAGYKHVEITPEAPTEISLINTRTAEGTTAAQPAKLEGTILGAPVAIECSMLSGMGTLTNKTTAGGEMFIHGEAAVEFSGCVVTKPAALGCVVKEEKITTKTLTGTTEGQGNAVKVTPKEGTTMFSVALEKCSVSGYNNTYPMTGTMKIPLSGATLSCTHAEITAQNTMKFGGQKAGFSGSVTTGMNTPVTDGEAITVT